MKLRSIKTGKEKTFSDEHAKKILKQNNSGFEYVGETPEIPKHDLTIIEGMTNSMITKLKKKGIVNYYQLFDCCEKTKSDIGITEEMLLQAENLIRELETANLVD